MVFCIPLLFVAAVAFVAWYIRDSLKVDDFTNKYVFVTGCDSGFGNLVAKQLDRLGFNVIAACLTESGSSELKTASSQRLKTVLLNVTDRTSIESAVEMMKRETGERGLYGLINNAGRSVPAGPNEWMHLEDYRKVLDVNLMGVIEVTLKCLPLLKKAKGRVVNVASFLGRFSMFGGGYCLSKYGVEAFSDSLRRDLRHFGIKVSIIEPGFFKTTITRPDLIEADLQRLWDDLPSDVRDSYGSKYLEEYNKVLQFTTNLLCSADISKVTSCMLHALTAQYPRTRYSAGWDAKFFWIPLSYMPAFVGDLLMTLLLPVPKQC